MLPFLVVVVFFVTVVFFAVAVFLAVVALVAVVFFAAVVLVAVVFLAVVFLAAVVFLVAVVLASVVFAAAVLEAYAGLALEHSGLLQNLRLLPLRSTCSTIIAPQSGHFFVKRLIPGGVIALGIFFAAIEYLTGFALAFEDIVAALRTFYTNRVQNGFGIAAFGEVGASQELAEASLADNHHGAVVALVAGNVGDLQRDFDNRNSHACVVQILLKGP